MKAAKDESMPIEHASNIDALTTLCTDVKLCDDDLSEQAKEQFSSHTEALRAQQLNARSTLADDLLSPFGRHLLCMTFEKDYTNSLVKRDPIILCGLPRTGTTLLYNLLACDPGCWPPLFTDMSEPIPPLARSDTSEQMQRNKIAISYTDMLNALGLTDCEREARASHPAYSFEEDLFILQHAGGNLVSFFLASHKDIDQNLWHV